MQGDYINRPKYLLLVTWPDAGLCNVWINNSAALLSKITYKTNFTTHFTNTKMGFQEHLIAWKCQPELHPWDCQME